MATSATGTRSRSAPTSGGTAPVSGRIGYRNAFALGADKWRYGSRQRPYPLVGNIVQPFLYDDRGITTDCSPIAWAIVVCSAHPGYSSTGVERLGSMTPYYADSQLHLLAGVIRIHPSYAFTNNQLRNVAMHELGHALGLGEYYCGDCYSVMNPTRGGGNTLVSQHWHDNDAIDNMYWWNGH